MPKYPRSPERIELATFLRTRRERLSPGALGLPGTARRRTPGLRREEVAQVAGVGLSWYTWLEQGREVEVSSHFLERIALALRLDAHERAHLFMLAQHRPPPAADAPDYELTPALRRTLESFDGPAYLASARLDVVAWNRALSAVFGDLAHLPSAQRNMLWLMFVSPEHRNAMPNWEEEAARGMLARFRSQLGRDPEDTLARDLIERLQAASPDFCRLWAEHGVSYQDDAPKRFRVGELGELTLEQRTLLLEEAPAIRLVVYAPADQESAQKIHELKARWQPTTPLGLGPAA